VSDPDELSARESDEVRVHAVLDRPIRFAGVRMRGIVEAPFLDDASALFGSSTGTFLSLNWGTRIRLQSCNGVVTRAVRLMGSPLDPFGAIPSAFRGRLRGIIGWSPAAILESDRRMHRLPGLSPDLFAGLDGLNLARRLIGEGRDWLSGRGRLRVGVTAAQAEIVRGLIGTAPHRAVVYRRGRLVSFVLGPRT